jgi:hypothetical protein
VKEIITHEVTTVENFKVIIKSDGRRMTITPKLVASAKANLKIFSEVTTELKELVQAKLIEDGLLCVGGTIAAITERELRADTSDELRALAALLAARGFACMAGGQLIIFLAANEDMIDDHRLLYF